MTMQTAGSRLPAPAELRRVRLRDLSAKERARLLARGGRVNEETRAQAREVVRAVRDGGDEAVRKANERFGGGLPARGAEVSPLRLPPGELKAARDRLPKALRAGLEQMMANIERFHADQLPEAERWVEVATGIEVGRLWRPLDRVGAYVPGGEAAYPSSLLMAVIPARLAGVPQIAIASPADREGRLSPALLAAAGLLELDEFYVMGGAQAVAALAHGTESIRAVDKIVGPGNAWVTAAKLEVFGTVGIDLPAGPSEVFVLADATADAAHVAADLLSQAEHGPDSAAVLVTTSTELADAVAFEIARQLPTLPRQAFLRSSLASAGLVVEVDRLDEALEFLNDYAPEHLSVVVEDDALVVRSIRHAGSVFLGTYAPESAGDYATGSNHILPTGGLARSSGPLSVESFGKWLQVQRVSREGLAGIRDTVGVVADAEGLAAHRRAVEIRFQGQLAEGGVDGC